MYLAPLQVARMCLLAIVANITGEVLEQVVHLIMNAISVTKIMRVVSVIFVPQDPSPSAKQSLALLTPVKINRLALLLSGYSTFTVEYLMNDFYFAFAIPLQGPSSSITDPNLLSSQLHPHAVDSYLTQEVLTQRIADPFTHPPFQTFRISPIEMIPKKTPGEFRCIQHLSYPYGASVTYSRIDDAVGLILRSGVHSFLSEN